MPSRRVNPFTDLISQLGKTLECTSHPPVQHTTSPENAARLWDTIARCPPGAKRQHLRWLGRNDLWFLLVFLLNRKHFLNDERKRKWTYDRCQEVEESPNNMLDLWPRESYKSEIITFGLTIQEILNDPELTFGIFSHTRPMAKDFLVLIKREFEFNELLKDLYSDVLWQDPKHECRIKSVSWSENEGITVRRRGNPKESTVEAWGLTDGQPTGKRYRRLIYDDVVSRDNTSPLMIGVTTDQFDNSLLLTASDPPRLPLHRYVSGVRGYYATTH